MTNEYFKHIQSLNIHQPDLTQPCVHFFANHCPPNLKQLQFRLDKSDFYTWIKNVTLKAAVDFARRLSTIKSLEISFDQFERNSTNFGLKMNGFYHFLKAIKGDRRVVV